MASNALTTSQIKNLEKQQYRLIGKHSAIKVCNWTKQSLRGKNVCYKKQFYGIDSWRCIQFTPTVQFCTENCSFCWRTLRFHNNPADDWDEPAFIVDGMIKEHVKMLRGFGGNEETPTKLYKEAQQPKHVAISLSGEPTLYPHLPELIQEIHKRGMTTFLVTNGTSPAMLRKLVKTPPTQLYVTVAGPTPEILKKVTKPILPNTWDLLMESLSLFKKFPTTTMRLTLVRKLNLLHPDLYAQLADQFSPRFLEAKGYVHVGGSQYRLTQDHMPYHREIVSFAKEIEKTSSYKIRDSMVPSRCVLLAREGTVQPNWCKAACCRKQL
ncbi:MAG: 4-demethylwyosine synthase TYW1 [Nanoarchaeota archaeon]|nr:4-demethylwyosine synthase TYW1 [Nanoarchaeota archaeon]